MDEGYVTLTGKTDWQYQREEAEFIAGNVAGVIGVDDEIELNIPEPEAGDVRNSITKAFKRDAKIDADDLSVEMYDGTVEVTGTVSSWSEHDAAIATARAAPGVRTSRTTSGSSTDARERKGNEPSGQPDLLGARAPSSGSGP